MRFILGLMATAIAQKMGKGQNMGQPTGMMNQPTPGNMAQAPTTIAQPVHHSIETTENATAPILSNCLTDWVDALKLSIDAVGIGNVVGISNHHHARWIGLLGETVFKALTALQSGNNTNNTGLTDAVVCSYASHQFLTYNFPHMHSAFFDPLMNLYADYYSGVYPHRDALDALVLPVVHRILVRETSRGMQNFVQNYVAPNTIGVNRATLAKYEGHYQFTPEPLPGYPELVTVEYKGKPAQINWQERGQFGTIKPYFNPLITYVKGLAPIAIGTAKYNTNLEESQTYGSNVKGSKDSYNWNSPLFWINDWSGLPVIWTQIARVHLDPKLSNLETARFFATLGLGIFEACNTCYGMKWGRVSGTNSLWRPITAIRSGDTHNHTAVPDWTPEIYTPMHPEYPSGHCSHTNAAMTVFRLVLGKEDLNDIVIQTDWNFHNPTMTPLPNRKYKTLTDLQHDVGDSRVLGGVHYRASCDDGYTLAQRAATAAHAFFYPKK